MIFVTSGTWNGNLGGYLGANDKCNADANKPTSGSPGAGKTYKALLDASNSTSINVMYYRVDGVTLIAKAT